jgi:hypothetical protein
MVKLLVLATIVVAVGPPTALAARSHKKAIWGPVSLDGRSQFPLYHRLGVGIFEMGLNWAAIAPTPPRNAADPADPAYVWPADVGYAIEQASGYQMRVMLQAIGTPAWANGGKPWNYPPARVNALAQFLKAASRRYPSVHLWMIWGEPDRGANFALTRRVPARARRLTSAQTRAPHVYAQMLDASYAALKSVGHRNLVIGGNTFTWGDTSARRWIENLRLPNGRPPRMDLYGHNPFCARGPNLRNPSSPSGVFDFSDLGRLSRFVDDNLASAHHKIKLFLSEWTIPTSRFDTEFNFHVTPMLQARWIRDAWRIVHRSRFIYALGWIHVFDDNESSGGLFDNRGHPKPGYYAFKNGR